jgi:hypothetical protein
MALYRSPNLFFFTNPLYLLQPWAKIFVFGMGLSSAAIENGLS